MTIKAQEPHRPIPLGHESVREQVRKHNEEFDQVVRESLNRVLREDPPELQRLRQTCAHQAAKLRSERVGLVALQQRLSDQHFTLDKLMGERAELLLQVKDLETRNTRLTERIHGLVDLVDRRETQLSKALCENVRLKRGRGWLRRFIERGAS